MELEAMMNHFFHLYGRRNRIFLPGLRDRIDFLNLAIGDLQEAIRKDTDDQIRRVALARVVSRIFCVAEHFRTLPLIEVMARKYPAHCSYCRATPCQCTEHRPHPTLEATPPEPQLHWTLRMWCTHLDQLYGARNQRKSIENVLNRLFKEISELQSLSMRIRNTATPLSLEAIEEEYALELADALAWTIAVANLLGVDLEGAVLDRFGNGCWNCHRDPCMCTNFNVEPVKWTS